jgi:hypothetical protein
MAPERSRALVASALTAVVAACVVLGEHTAHHTSDSVVPVLASLYHWTPFYWEQNRFGMIVPLLAMPISDPWMNLQVENWITAACGVGLFFLLPAFFMRAERWLWAGMVGAAYFVWAAAPEFRFFSLGTDQPYSVSLALGVGALLVWPDAARPGWPRAALALAMSLASAWVNTAAPPFVLMLLLARHLVRGRRPSSLRAALRDPNAHQAAMLLGAMLFGYELTRIPNYRPTRLTGVSPREWAHGLARLFENGWSMLDVQPVALGAGLLLLAVAAVLAAVRRRATGPAVGAAVAMAAAALAYAGFVAALAWTRANEYAFRYTIPSVFLLLCSASVIVVSAWPVSTRRFNRAVSAALAVALLAATVASYGAPSPAGARRRLDQSLGDLTANLVSARCTHFLGGYWAVWPRVFHTNLVYQELGEARRMWGISFRSASTQALWRSTPESSWRVCTVHDEPEREALWRTYRVPAPFRTETVGALDVFVMQ